MEEMMDQQYRDLVDRLTETRRHFDVVGESLRGEIRQVAEGVADLEGRFHGGLKGLREEMVAGFSEVKSMIKFSHTELDRGLSAIERKIDG